jgi:hypothetical protein
MTIKTIEESQRRAAKVAGLSYVIGNPLAVFAELYVFGQLIVYSNAAATAQNIMAHERLFRLGVASNLIVFVMDIVLITALYVVLRPINRNLALLAAFWGLIETAILVVTTLNDFEVLRVLSGADYLRVFEANQLQAMARLSIAAHGASYNVALVFFGLRSTMFCYLWFKSNFVPKPLAVWGMVSSLLVAIRSFTVIIFPALAQIVTVEYYAAPIFLFEMTMGFWLLLKGLRPAALARPVRGSD